MLYSKGFARDLHYNLSDLILTWSGCQICKHRRIKCDEKHPQCGQCERAGSQCDYDVPKAKIFEIGAGPDFDSACEQQSFSYFVSQGAKMITTFQPSAGPFWQQIGLRLSHTFPSVKHAITAVGAVQAPLHFMKAGTVVETRQPENNQLSLTNLARGMHLASIANPRDVPLEAILASSIFFMASAIWTDKIGVPAMHVGAGLKILNEYARGTYQGLVINREEVDSIFIPMFQRFVVAACVFSDGFPEQFAPNIATNAYLDMDLDKATTIADLENAFEMVGTLLKCVLRLREGVSIDNIFARVTSALDESEAALTKLYLQRTGDDATLSHTGNTFDYDYRHLRMHLTTIRIMFETVQSNDELAYDKFRKEFMFILVECKRLLQEDEEVTASRDAPNLRTTHGIIPSLFFTATRCRDLAIRNQAIELLHSTARTERGWSSCMATTLARFVIDKEHCLGGLMTPSTPAHSAVPVQRICLESVSFSSSDRQAYITYFQCYPNTYQQLQPELLHQLTKPSEVSLNRSQSEISAPVSDLSHSDQSPVQDLRRSSQSSISPLLRATIPYTATPAVERDGVTGTMANKVLHAFGHTGIVLYSPRIACHCA